MTTQTLPVGIRVTASDRNEEYDRVGGKVHGRTGTIIAYATPLIQANQVWTDESYRVVLDGDTPGTYRVLNADQLTPVEEYDGPSDDERERRDAATYERIEREATDATW